MLHQLFRLRLAGTLHDILFECPWCMASPCSSAHMWPRFLRRYTGTFCYDSYGSCNVAYAHFLSVFHGPPTYVL